jgi:hypothetical protein
MLSKQNTKSPNLKLHESLQPQRKLAVSCAMPRVLHEIEHGNKSMLHAVAKLVEQLLPLCAPAVFDASNGLHPLFGNTSKPKNPL